MNFFFHGMSFVFYSLLSGLTFPDFHVSSDAAGLLGFGTIFDPEWFVGGWSAAQQALSIPYKELFLVVIAASLWAPFNMGLKACEVLFRQ